MTPPVRRVLEPESVERPCLGIPAGGQEEIMGAIHKSPEPGTGPDSAMSTPTAALLAELNPNTDLAGVVERVARNNVPWLVIPAAALTAWEERDREGWAKVAAWLAVKGVTIGRV